jgi:hypothetical protein
LENHLTKEINLDIILLKLFTSKQYYSKYSTYITKYLVSNYKTNNKLLFKLYRCLDLLHQEHETVSLEDLYLRLLREYPALPTDEKELAQETLQKALGAIFDEGEASTLIQRQYEAAKAAEVAVKAIQVTEGKAQLAELNEILGEDHLQQQENENVYYENDLEGLYETTAGTSGLRWPLMSFNKSLGSLREGDFGFVFMRPEAGKTTLLSHAATFMVENSGESALWVNNEEGGNKVLLRNYQSMLGCTTQQLFADRDGNQSRYRAMGGQRLRLLNDPTIDKRGIERCIAEVSPKLVVIDQLDKVLGFDAERYDLLMKAKYQWARELAKKFKCAVIGVCQAGGSGENKKYLVMTDVDSSHTAKQGEADWIIGLGKINDPGYENIRYVNIIKNKLVGDKDSIPELRHGQFDVIIQPEIGRYKDRIDWK